MKRILVVDDNEDLLTNMSFFLKKQGFQVAVSQCCNDGIEKFISFKPDIIFLDINVGHQDGREMCRQIKSAAENSQVPVILISANEDAIKTYLECKADGAINKPFDMAIVLDVIKKMIAV